MIIDPNDTEYLQFATVREIEYLDAVKKHGSVLRAAKALGVVRGSIQDAMRNLKKRAAAKGYSPAHDMTKTVPDGFKVKGVSTYYDENGKPRAQWVKSQVDAARQEQIVREAFAEMASELPRVRPRQAPGQGISDLLNCYVITDYHFGMLSWAEETGESWDITIAENLIIRWFERAIALAPQAETVVFAQLSDFLHADGMEALTPASKHLLDVDTRFAKVVRSVIRILRQVINMLLAKYSKLHIIMADANHDPVSQIWLREWFSAIYENEPRVTVDRTPNPYNAYEFGKVGLFFHHGHKRKVIDVDRVFAAQYREMFGRTKYAYAHMGHLHSIDVKETNLMIVEQHRTLAPADAYAARGGWLSGRDAKVITYHRQFGEVGRVTINSKMLESA